MNDDEARVMGLRALAWGGWQWMRGAATTDGDLFMRAFDAVTRTMACVQWGGDPVRVVPIESLAPPDLRDPATMGAALALWQARPGHVFRVPCPVLTNAAAYGLTDPRTIRALVDAMEATPPR